MLDLGRGAGPRGIISTGKRISRVQAGRCTEVTILVKAEGSDAYLLTASPNKNGSLSDVKDLNIAKCRSTVEREKAKVERPC